MKQILDFQVLENVTLNDHNFLLKLTHPHFDADQIMPGQFVEVKVDDSATTFLRRPISVHYVDIANKELWLLIQKVGDGSKKLGTLSAGDSVSIILPLGNSFSMPEKNNANVLLIGGGVGTAPLLYFGKQLKEAGHSVTFLLGARKGSDLVQLNEFAKYGVVECTTEDGSLGEKGFVTQHSVLSNQEFDSIHTCGPKPMMLAVARIAREKDIFCEVSLENKMACGFGVCLCCVEKTVEGHKCVCTDGPVFNLKDLQW